MCTYRFCGTNIRLMLQTQLVVSAIDCTKGCYRIVEENVVGLVSGSITPARRTIE